jgi:hypothetical protein
VDTYAALFEMARLLLAEDDADRTAELLFRRLLEITEATRGFIVVRSGDDYEEKFDVHFDRARISGAERRFSRTLVRQVIQSGQTIRSPDLVADPRFASMESAEAVGGCAVLVAPLPHLTKSLRRPRRLGGSLIQTALTQPCFGSQSSTLFPSGSMIHANLPLSSDSGPFTTSMPLSLSCASNAVRSSTR